MRQEFGGEKSEGINQTVEEIVGRIFHHTAHFLIILKAGVYDETNLTKAKDGIVKLSEVAKNPKLISKAEELSKMLEVINPADKAGDAVVKKIQELSDAMQSERRF